MGFRINKRLKDKDMIEKTEVRRSVIIVVSVTLLTLLLLILLAYIYQATSIPHPEKTITVKLN